MQIDLSGKRALVAGSTQGIGKAIAIALANAGAEIILLARNEAALQKSVEELPSSMGQSHAFLVADFDHPNVLEEVLKNSLDISTSPVHILVNNSGGPAPGKAIDANKDAYREAFNRHLICNQILASFCAEGMKSEGYGRIINIISTSVRQPIAGLGVSNTIRGAVNSWSKTISQELAPFGITVNNILPGATATERLTGIIDNKSKKSGRSHAQVEEEMRAEIPAGRFATPEEPAYLAVFLSSAFASYINGTSIAVDGGRTLCL
jgi:3-oxoacyl-[acyl-carrier protein] reductase